MERHDDEQPNTITVKTYSSSSARREPRPRSQLSRSASDRTRDITIGLWAQRLGGNESLRKLLEVDFQLSDEGWAELVDRQRTKRSRDVIRELSAGSKLAALSNRGAEERARAAAAGCRLVVWGDLDYPPRLAESVGAPAVFAFRGDRAGLGGRWIAVVGTRRMDRLGRRLTERLVARLPPGIGVVSGGARGVDTTAHRAALEASRPTLVVLGTGPDSVYPAENAALYELVAESRGSGLLWQFPPGSGGFKGQFRRRNKTIAGLAEETVVVQAPRRSGALSTATSALREARKVGVLAGPAFEPTYAGGLELSRADPRVSLVLRASDVGGANRQGCAPDREGRSGDRRRESKVRRGRLGPGQERREVSQIEKVLEERAMTTEELAEALAGSEGSRGREGDGAAPGGSGSGAASTVPRSPWELELELLELEISGRVLRLPGGRFGLANCGGLYHQSRSAHDDLL